MQYIWEPFANTTQYLEVRSLGVDSHVDLWMARRAQGIKDCISCLLLVHRRDAVPKVCLHSDQLHQLSPASSPAWTMLLPKEKWAEPKVWAVGAENSSLVGCVCIGEGGGTPSTLLGSGQGRDQRCHERNCITAESKSRYKQRATTAVWFTALLDSIRNTADPEKIPPKFYTE